MKNKSSQHLKLCWQILTEVPGWADAPIHARLTRALPIAFPVLAVTAILGWHFIYHLPRFEADQQALQPLASLEQEISTLQLGTSQSQVTELKERTAAATRLLVSGPKDLPEVFQELKTTFRTLGWEATFQASEATEEVAGAQPLQISFLPVRAKLKALASNQDRFVSLITALDRLSSSGKRIDLTRVAIRADESRWQAVEVNFRLLCPVLDAKTPQ